jgi:putative molybdopterin biosynthesis protein
MSSRGPSPEAAYTRWVAACADAGWDPGRAAGQVVAEEISVRDAVGRVTAAAVRARWPSPRFRCAAMDGIAVAADRVTGRVGAGNFVWVDTGDPIPAGLDTVVERERVQLAGDGSALVAGPVTRGGNVRASGEDFQAGQLLIPAGRRLRPADLGAAAAAGHAALSVARPPVVAIIPTGDEIRPVGSVPGPGEFTDSNSVMLAARAAQAGAVPVVTGVAPDDPDVLAAAAREAAAAADLVLVIAGSSRGRGDFTAAVVAQAGGVAVHGVAVRPGHPVLLGHVKPGPVNPGPVKPGQSAGTVPVPVIGVPGYPLAAAVIFELFAAPLLSRLQGALAPERAFSTARLGRDWVCPPDVEDWVPVSLDGDRVAVPDQGHGAAAISRLARADAWWRIPIGRGRFASGDPIEVLPI